MQKISIFASGSGTNVENIIKYFNNKPVVINKIYTNKPKAYVITRAESHNIPVMVFDRTLLNSGKVTQDLIKHSPDLIVLAGFLWLIPTSLINAFPNKIVNIHPALLPKYGGKGMYGDIVHEAVILNNEKESGITIHYVNEKYDEGNILYQAKCSVDSNETPESLATKIHQLEYKHYPEVIEKLIIPSVSLQTNNRAVINLKIKQ